MEIGALSARPVPLPRITTFLTFDRIKNYLVRRWANFIAIRACMIDALLNAVSRCPPLPREDNSSQRRHDRSVLMNSTTAKGGMGGSQ